MPTNEIPLQKLHIRLVKPNITEFDDVVEDPDHLQKFELKRGFAFTGRLYIAHPFTGVPPWLEFVQTGIEDAIGRITNRTNAAVLLIRCSNRIFAITFGFGRHQIKENLLVPDFGIRTALNSVEPSSLRSMDSLTIEDQARYTRSQVSRASSLNAFGLDVGRDILRAVTGKPKSHIPLHSVSGSEFTLYVSARTEFSGLGSLCSNLQHIYRTRDYQDNFSWVDNVSRVRDIDITSHLDEQLLEDIKSGRHSRAYIAPPELIDWDMVQGFNYTHNRASIENDMQLSSYLRGRRITDLTSDDLSSDKVFVYGIDNERPIEQWPIYKCFIFETNYRSHTFVLASGSWYEIDPVFSRRIQKLLNAIPHSNIHFTNATTRSGLIEAEGVYNERVAASSASYALLDKKLGSCLSAGSPIEFCDILSSSRHIVHVKHYKGGSSTLSHLFAQARVSAEAFLSDEQFRTDIRDHLAEYGTRWNRIVPIERPNPSQYIVVLAIIGIPNGRITTSLPFFSKLNLVRTYESLTSLGFAVNLLNIPIQ